jgi:transcription factor E2F3
VTARSPLLSVPRNARRCSPPLITRLAPVCYRTPVGNDSQWKGMGSSSSTNMQAELDQLKEQVRESAEQEQWLDSAILQMQNSLRGLADDDTNAEYAYVTHEDVRSIPAFAPDTVIAIKAPSGTTLEVPDPDEGMEFPQRRYQIFLKSQSGPVEVFVVSQTEGEEGGDGSAPGATAATATSVAADSPAAADEATSSGGRRSSKRKCSGESADASPSSASRRAVAADAGGAAADDFASGGGLLSLTPHDSSATDHWVGQSHLTVGDGSVGIADFFQDPVKQE